jgi:predicted Zn finger-like uncharacterized protein
LFTVCPKCTLTLVVTTVDLRAGQGYVRCGRCANVFNALIALREGDPSSGTSDTAKRRLLETAPDPSVEPARGSGVAIDPEPEPEPEPQPEAELQLEPEPAVEEEALLEFDAAATDVSEIFISPPEAEHDTGSGNYEAVVLSEEQTLEAAADIPAEEAAGEPAHTDTIAADDWSLLDDPPADDESVIEESPLAQESPESEPESEPAPEPEQAPEPDPPWVEEMFAEAEAEVERGRTAEREAPLPPRVEPSADEASAPSDAAIGALLNPAPKPRAPWQYVAGVVALALLLVAQVLHHNRRTLALSPTFGPAASEVYGWFGVVLVPRWDLTAYSVKQLGAEAEGSEGTRLRVRLSLQNESARVQPLPLLRLTLQDRYGNAVATRDLEPADYLPKRVADQRLLEPDQRIDAELHVIDPGKAAIGFEIDACLRAESGSIGCANEARRRAAS